VRIIFYEAKKLNSLVSAERLDPSFSLLILAVKRYCMV